MEFWYVDLTVDELREYASLIDPDEAGPVDPGFMAEEEDALSAMNRNLHEISIKTLIRVLSGLGYKVSPKISKVA